MTGFVDPTDPSDVEAVLGATLRSLGPAAVVSELSQVPGLYVAPSRPGGLFRSATPAVVAYGDQALVLGPRGATLDHVVGGVRLGSEAVTPPALPGILAALVTRAVRDSGAVDDMAVRFTALRDAVDAAS